MAAASPAEWAAAGSLGVTAISLIALAVAFADADAGYFDPRYQLARVVESGRLDPLLIAVTNARHDARLALREAAVSAAALLMLLTPAAPESAR